MSKAFLGTGWAFPVEVDEGRSVALSNAEHDIEQAIWLILSTAPGERVMRPDFGCGINDFTFTTVDAATLERVEASVREALTMWEHRIDVVDVDASDEAIESGRLLVHLTYRVRATNAAFNMVYPFYLTEG